MIVHLEFEIGHASKLMPRLAVSLKLKLCYQLVDSREEMGHEEGHKGTEL
jgi:hypothetical protein